LVECGPGNDRHPCMDVVVVLRPRPDGVLPYKSGARRDGQGGRPEREVQPRPAPERRFHLDRESRSLPDDSAPSRGQRGADPVHLEGVVLTRTKGSRRDPLKNLRTVLVGLVVWGHPDALFGGIPMPSLSLFKIQERYNNTGSDKVAVVATASPIRSNPPVAKPTPNCPFHNPSGRDFRFPPLRNSHDGVLRGLACDMARLRPPRA
jgi:hypothetical protein